MKRKNEHLEKNISRLVKLASDANKPSKHFADSLIEDALCQLKQPKDQVRGRKDIAMNVKKIFAYAAAIIIVCGVTIALTLPKLNKTTGKPEMIVKEIKPSTPVELVYTEKPGTSVIVADAVEAKRLGKLEDKLVAKAADAEKAGKLCVNRLHDGRNEAYSYERKDKKSDHFGIQHGDSATSTSRRICKKVPVLGDGPIVGGLFRRTREPVPGHYPMAHGGTVPPNGEAVDAMFFKNYGVNPFVDTEADHLSTFATDVDTGSYTVVRGYLHDGHVPPSEAVRVEEFVNYFKYGYAAPQEDDFAVYAEASPWSFGQGRRNSYLLRLGLKGRQVSDENRKPAVLTFVIDVSGSMGRENRLGLVKKSLRMLVEKLRESDRIGIAVYGRRGRKVMEHQGLGEKNEILAAIESLCTEGSTNAEEGIRIGYEMAEKAYKPGCINRVILCSDGVANVGRTGADGILEVIKSKADKGVTLSAIGFGMGNYNDVMMERLGDKGNGHYIYIDTIAEAKRIFEDNLTGTLQVIARDVKVQVDFNTDVVRSYRLIGYENRDVPDDKFRDDKYDGGEVGAGHSVTALYELKLWPEKKGTVATTYVRYKDAETRAITEFKSSIATEDFNSSFKDSGGDFRLAATVAEFAEILRKSYWAKDAKLSDTLRQAEALLRQQPGNADIIELVDLISKAKQLVPAEVKSVEVEESEVTE